MILEACLVFQEPTLEEIAEKEVSKQGKPVQPKEEKKQRYGR